MTLKLRISQSEEWLSGTKLAASNASESIRREGEAKKKWRRQTDRKNDCVARDRGRGRRGEGDKRDADIKLEARQIKREEKKLEQRRAEKKT